MPRPSFRNSRMFLSFQSMTYRYPSTCMHSSLPRRIRSLRYCILRHTGRPPLGQRRRRRSLDHRPMPPVHPHRTLPTTAGSHATNRTAPWWLLLCAGANSHPVGTLQWFSSANRKRTSCQTTGTDSRSTTVWFGEDNSTWLLARTEVPFPVFSVTINTGTTC